jgi:methyl-accepting chemotaxis protein
MLNNVKIGPKLIGGFIAVAVITLIIGVLGINNIGKINNMLNELYEKHLIGISRAKEANINLIYIGRAVRNLILAKNLEERETHSQNIEKYNLAIRAELEAAEKTIMTEEGKLTFKKAYDDYEEYYSSIKSFVELIKKQELLKINVIIMDGLAQTRQKADNADHALSEFAIMKDNLGKQMYEQSDIVYDNMKKLLILFVSFAVVAGILIGFFLSRSISVPLVKVAAMIQEMSKGHLDTRLKINRADEIGLMAKAMDEFSEDLQKNVVGVMQKIANGTTDMEITPKDNADEISPALIKTVAALQGLINETKLLAQESVNGNLSKRGAPDKFKGAYREIIEGLNKTLDAILDPINEATVVLEKVANRDLTVRVKGDYKGDHAKIKNALNATVENLDSALQQVNQGTEQVSSAAQQISSGSQALAQGANEQASSLEEVSSSLEEMSSMTKQNADNAGQAKSLAAEANNNASVGKQAMAKMSQSINKIKESSDQTAKIVKTIDEIAMQTNLLALNAAVEAARAGEAGRGFAVVAEEVRNLAQRSAEAAKNTANMIEESVKNAEEGVKIATEVASSFESIAESNTKVDNLIAEIAAASQEQSQGISQVSTAVAQMDTVTQQNAANSEESASAAEELSSQSEELQNMVTQFKLTNSGQQGIRRPASHQGSTPVHSARPHNGVHGKNEHGHTGRSQKISNVHHETIDPKHIIPLEDDEALKEF